MSTLPREAKNTPYFIIIKGGTNTGNIIEARLSRGYICVLIVRLKEKNPLYAGVAINFEALNRFPDNKSYEDVFIYDGENIGDEPNVEYYNGSYGNMVSSITMPTSQEL